MSIDSRIAFVSLDFHEAYGATVSFRSLIQVFAEKRPDRFGFFGFDDGLLRETAQELGIAQSQYAYTWHLDPIRLRGLLKLPFQYLLAAMKLCLFFACNRSELVYINSSAFSLPAFCGWLMRRPVVVHVRETGTYFRPGGIYRSIRRFVFRNCVTRFVAISHATKKHIQDELGEVPIVVVHNGIDLTQYHEGVISRADARAALDLAAEGKLVVGVGRMNPKKGVSEFLKVARRCEGLLPDATFVLVGGPLDSSYFLNTVKPALDRCKNVRLFPYQKDVRPFYAAADLILTTTLEEAFGRVNVEAMAMGRCVVSSAVDAIPEIVDHESTGILFGHADLEEVPAIIQRLLSDSTTRERVARAEREEVVRRFGLDTHVRTLSEILNQAAKK